MFWSSGESGVKCNLCPHECNIPEEKTGICGVRKNIKGKLYSLVYGKVICKAIDPIEKKPLFHFYPGKKVFSIGTVGCNLRCQWCQNYDISQFARETGKVIGKEIGPEEIVKEAKELDCEMIAYTYNEPTIFYEMVYDTSKIAKKVGLKNIWVTNGYINKEALKKISSFIDAANIDLKSFSNETYLKLCGARLDPVLETIKMMHEKGIWIEITTLVIPNVNDSGKELKEIASFIASIDNNIPWHVSAFHPDYKMVDKEVTPIHVLEKAKRIGNEAGLKYVYCGNISKEENTLCTSCKKVLIRRKFFNVLENNISRGKCSRCGKIVDGRFE